MTDSATASSLQDMPRVVPERAPLSISETESRQIDLLRAMAIFFMVGVHVYPATRASSLLYQGELHAFWLFYVDFLGRASVAVLSFVAGYVLVAQSGRKGVLAVLQDRLRTVYLPMVSWSVVKIAAVAALAVAEGGVPRDLAARLEVAGVLDALNTVFALTAPPANLPLGFLRDLLVSLVLVRLLLPLIRRAGAALLALVAVLAVFDLTEPVVLRPAIPLFILLGTVIALRGLTLSQVSHWRLALPAAAVLALAWLADAALFDATSVPVQEAANLLKRGTLTFLMLWLSARIVARYGCAGIGGWRQMIFVTFLSHGITSQVLGVGWQLSGIDNHAPVYLAFFFASIAVFFLVGAAITRALTVLPGPVQVALAGRRIGDRA
jgi:succinoglycan biosynthesis protein ExoH